RRHTSCYRDWSSDVCSSDLDAVLVAVAHPSVVVDALAAARPGGRVLLFAANDPVTRIEFPAAAVGTDEKEILGSYSAAADIQEEIGRASCRERGRMCVGGVA